MKKITFTFLMFIICFFMISCGGSEEQEIDRELNEFKLQNNVEKISKRKGLNDLMNHNIEMKISTISINK